MNKREKEGVRSIVEQMDRDGLCRVEKTIRTEKGFHYPGEKISPIGVTRLGLTWEVYFRFHEPRSPDEVDETSIPLSDWVDSVKPIR